MTPSVVRAGFASPRDLFVEYEWVGDGKPYREAMIPAAVPNRYPVRVLDDDDVAKLQTRFFPDD